MAQREWPTHVEDAPTAVGAPPPAPAPPPVDPRRHELWPWLTAFLLLVIAGLVALWWFDRHHGATHAHRTTSVTQPTTAPLPKATVAVPRLVGETQAAATARLAALGLAAKPTPVKSAAAPGTVVAQTPAPGTKLKRGAAVTLTVARGKPATPIPAVTGTPAPQAVAVLRKAGFQTAVKGVPSAQPKGTVVAEAPPAGTKAAAGSVVHLNISRGQPTATTTVTTVTTVAAPPPAKPPAAAQVAVPNVVSKAQSAAIGALEGVGLHETVALVQSQEPGGRVVAQQPAAGTKASRGSTVQLQVSLGPNPAQTTSVPDVTGQQAQAAVQALQQAGFTVQTVNRKVTNSAQDGKVVAELPSGQAPQGWTITLVVARAS